MRFLFAASPAMGGFAGGALAAQPVPWQIGFQPAASPMMAMLGELNDIVLVIIFAIAALVTGLLGYTIWRFGEKRNPVPSRNTHHTLLEIAWTMVPVIILVVIAVPSFRLLYYQDVVPKADMTLKAVGNQWFWSYEYPDHGMFSFDSVMIPDDELKPGQTRLLETDNRVVLPVDTTIRLIVTAADVLHSWAMPAFGIKIDAVPGRLNETWFRIDRAGVYFGQCSELCGINHGFMPIAIEAVSKAKFNTWVRRARQKSARAGAPEAGTLARLDRSVRPVNGEVGGRE